MGSSRLLARTVLPVFVAVTMCAVLATSADARRKPTDSERQHIKSSIEGACDRSQAGHCTVQHIWMSTVNSDYAYISGVQDNDTNDMSGVIKRTRHGGHKWKWALSQSGGPMTCRQNEKHVPRKVLHDLHVIGSANTESGTERC